MKVQTRAGDKGVSRARKAPVRPGPALPASLAQAGGVPQGRQGSESLRQTLARGRDPQWSASRCTACFRTVLGGS